MQKKRTYQRKKAVPRKTTKRRKPQPKGFRGWWKRMTSL